MTGAADWQSRVGDVWAAEWHRTDRSFSTLDRYLDAAIRRLAPEHGWFLDVGCGAGATTLALSRARPQAQVLGVYLSSALIEAARTRLALDRLSLRQARAAPEVLVWPECGEFDFAVGDAVAIAAARGPFDLIVSRHGVMFFDDSVAAFASLRAAARPGASLVFTCFADRAANRFATLVDDLRGPTGTGWMLFAAIYGARLANRLRRGLVPDHGPGPFAFADRARVAALLARAGWSTPAATRIDFAYRAGQGDDPVADAADFLSRIGPVASALRDRPDLRRRLPKLLARYRTGDAVDLPARAWLWQATAGEAA